MRDSNVLRPELHSHQGGAPHTLAVCRADAVVVVVFADVEAEVQTVGGGLAAVLRPAPQLSQPRQIKLQTRPTEIKNKLSRPEKSERENQKI